MEKSNAQKNIELLKEILEDEIQGRVSAALSKMDDDYKMTWVYKRKETLFPSEKANKSQDISEVYKIEGREYRINHILADENTVMAEMTESYPDPKTGKVYRTPMAMVWEIKNGKILRGRHYCDPQLSYLDLTNEDIDNLYK